MIATQSVPVQLMECHGGVLILVPLRLLVAPLVHGSHSRIRFIPSVVQPNKIATPVTSSNTQHVTRVKSVTVVLKLVHVNQAHGDASTLALFHSLLLGKSATYNQIFNRAGQTSITVVVLLGSALVTIFNATAHISVWWIRLNRQPRVSAIRTVAITVPRYVEVMVLLIKISVS